VFDDSGRQIPCMYGEKAPICQQKDDFFLAFSGGVFMWYKKSKI